MNAFLRKSLFTLVAVLCTTFINAQYRYLDETFESGISSVWTQESSSRANVWGATEGVAVLEGQALNAVSALISPEVDIAEAVEPIFRFSYKNEQFDGKLNDFAVYARVRPDTAWVLLYQSSAREKKMVEKDFIISDTLKSSTFQLKFEVTNNGGGMTAVDNVVVSDSKSCVAAPINLSVAELSQSHAKLTWMTDSFAVNTRIELYEIVQKKDTKLQLEEKKEFVTEATFPVSKLLNIYEAKNLKPGTDYRAYVLADCEYGDLSAYATIDFTTICDIWATPYFDDFEDYTARDLKCWRLSADGASYVPIIDTTTVAQSGKKSLKFYSAKDKYGYAYTPQFDVEDISTMAVSFYIYSDKTPNATYSTELVVGVLTNPADPSTFTPVHTVSPSQTGVWQRVDVSLKEYDGDSYGNYGKYIAFRSGNAEKTNYVWIDDITLDKIGCFAPQLAQIDKLTSHELTMSWTEMGLSKSYNVKISTTKLDAEGLTQPAFIDLSVDTTSFTVTTLKPNSTYYVYIQSECGTWTPDPIIVETETVWTIGYHDNISSYKTTVPAEWRRNTASSATSNFTIVTTSTYNNKLDPQSGTTNGAICFKHPTTAVQTYVIFPQLEVDRIQDVQVSFWLNQYTTSAKGKGIVVGVCDVADIATAVAVDTIYPFDQAFEKYEKHNVTFENYAGNGKYFAMWTPEDKPSAAITYYIDDIHIDSLKLNNSPEAFRCVDVSQNSAKLSWSSTGASKWEVEVYATNTRTGTPIVSSETTTTFYNVVGLEKATTYYAFIRTLSELGNSDWSVPVAFTTQDILTIPYNNDFTNETTGTNKGAPKGWFLYNTNASASASYVPYVCTTTWSAASGSTIPTEVKKNSLYFNTTSSYKDAYAVMPMLVDSVEMRTLLMSFYAHTNSTTSSYGRAIEVGVMTDPNDPETFVKVSDIELQTAKVTEKFFVAFGGYQGTGRYIAFRSNMAKTVQLMVDNIEIEFVSECSEVTNVKTDVLTNKDAIISWVKGNKETRWNFKVYDQAVEYDAIDSTPAAIYDGEVTNNPYSLTGLKPLTTYYVYVQAVTDNCKGSWSQCFEFTTPCPDVFEVPYVWGFDEYANNDVPNCWISKGATSTSTMPKVYNGTNCRDYNTGTAEGNVFYMSSYNTGYSYAILPEFNEDVANLQISFYGYTTKTPDVSYIEIGVMEDIDSTYLDPTVFYTKVPTNDKLFTFVERVEVTEMKQWQPFLVMFDKYKGKGKRIAFRQGLHSTSSNGYFYIDNLKVDRMPLCKKITGIEAKKITHEQVTLHWNVGDETGWNIKVAKAKINPNAEDTANLVVAEKTVTTMPYTLENIDANTEYFVYIQGYNTTLDCVGDWSEPFQFISNCAPLKIGYTDNFEQYQGATGEGSALRCWIKSGSDTWIAYPFLHTESASGHKPVQGDSVCLYMQNASSYVSATESNAIVTSYVATPELDVDSIEQCQVSFRAYTVSSSYTLGQFEIGVMTDPYDPTTYRAVYSDTIPYNSVTKEWTDYTVNFLNYTNDDFGDKGKCIVFRCLPGQNNTYPDRVATNKIYFDNIVIEPYSPCSTPRRATLIDATVDGATFKWQSPAADSYRVIAVQREEANPMIADLDTIVSSNPCTLEGLKSNTNYYLYVQSNCGADASAWSDPLQVRTLGCSSQLPYYESFEGHNVYISSSKQILPYCWNGYAEGVLAEGGLNESTSPKPTAYPYITTGSSVTTPTRTGSYHLLSSKEALSILPEFDVKDIRQLSMSMYYSLGSTTYSLEVGVLEDIDNPQSYVTLDVLECSKSNVYNEFVIDFAKYDVPFNKNSRIAFKAISSGAYIDDVYVNYTDGLWKPANLKFVSATHNSVSFTWKQIGTPDSYDVILVNGNDTIKQSFTTNEVTILGLPSNTEYDVFVYAVKDGVRSDVSEPFSVFTYSVPAQLPYANDFNVAEENAEWHLYTKGTSTNSWMFGKDAVSNDTMALYISNDGEHNLYQVGVASQSWAYRTIEVKEAGVYDVAFRTRFNAIEANSAHKFKVLFMPASYVPDGTSLIDFYGRGTAVVLKKSNPLVVLEETYSNGEWSDYVGKVIVDEPGYYNFAACFVTTTQKSTPKYAPAIDSLRIAPATCYAPYNFQISEVLDTAVTLLWEDTKIAEWDMIVSTKSVVDPSTLTAEDIVVDTTLTTTKFVVKTVPSTPYYVYLKAACDDVYSIFDFATSCQQAELPYVNNFSGYTISSTTNPITSTCWSASGVEGVYLNTSYHSVNINKDTLLEIKSMTVVAMPLMSESIKDLEISFEMSHGLGVTAPTRFELGVVTDPYNPKETFEALETFNCPGVFSASNQLEFGKYYYNFSAYEGNARYIAFRSPTGAFYLDEVVVSKLPECPRPYSLKVAGVTSNSANLTWSAMDNQSSWVVAVTSTEVSATVLDSLVANKECIFVDTVNTNLAVLANLPHTSTLFAYVKSNCNNSGTWSTALEFNSGYEVCKLPYSENFQEVDNDQLPLAWNRYDISLEDVRDGEALRAAPRAQYSAFAVDVVNQKPDTLHSLYTTLYKAKDAANIYRWVVGPEIYVSEKSALAFDVKFSNSSILKTLSEFSVLISTDNGKTWASEDQTKFANAISADYRFVDYLDVYKRVFIELDKYVGDTIRFAFYTKSLDNNTTKVNIDNITIKPTQVYDYTDTGFEKRDYEGYGFEFDYTEMNPGVKEAKRYAAGSDLTISDSIINIDLTVLPILRTDIEDMMCPGDEVYTENGFSVSEVGVYQQHHIVASGADSVVTLTLGIFEGETEFAISETIKQGESFLFGGKNLTESGVYTDSLVNQYGCDSVVVLTLTVEPTSDVALENTELVELVLTPNPVQVGEELLINATFSAEELEGMVVEVFNSVGQCVYTSQPAVAPIVITALPQAGVYMVNITTASGNRYQGKVIVK